MKHGTLINRLAAGAVIAVSLPMFLAGCRKELCYNHYRAVNVNAAWESVWERDYGRKWVLSWDAARWEHEYSEFLPGIPEGMTMLL